MSAPRVKRPFAGAASDPSQRQITSFFTTRLPSDSTSTSASAPNPPSRQPILPASVQSNLLSVGMRIRKSVPEGYKTASTSAFKLWTDATPAKSAVALVAAQRELAPFCGINAVGGWDVQPAWRDGKQEEDDVAELDAVPELTLSQESVDSAVALEPSRKRIFDDDDVAGTMPTLTWDGEISPRSLAPMVWGNGRIMAIPRSRAKKSAVYNGLDQENMMVVEDFEDAEFLVYDGSHEIDMTG